MRNRSRKDWISLSALLVALLILLVPRTVTAQSTFGTFQGILRSDSNNDESFGFITLVLQSSGKFSMRFNLGVNRVGRHSYAKTGMFDENGAYHFEGPPVTDTRYAIARIIDLQLDSTSNPTSIHGTVTDLTHSSTVELERVAVFPSGTSAGEAGRYTFLIENPGDASLPGGAGFGTALVNSRGRVSMSGRSADEMLFRNGASLTVNGRLPVFAKLGGSTKGILCGWLMFSEAAESDFGGTLTWLGPEVPGPNNAFVNEFSGDISVTGSRYSFVKGNPVLQTTSSTNNVHLTLSGGGLETQVERDVTLTSGNRVFIANKARGDALTMSASQGTFTGKFSHSDGHLETFRGAILQKQNRGAGHFVDREGEPGKVELVPQ